MNLSLCEMAIRLQYTSLPHRSGFTLYSPLLSDSVTLKVDEIAKNFRLSCKVLVKGICMFLKKRMYIRWFRTIWWLPALFMDCIQKVCVNLSLRILLLPLSVYWDLWQKNVILELNQIMGITSKILCWNVKVFPQVFLPSCL